MLKPPYKLEILIETVSIQIIWFNLKFSNLIKHFSKFLKIKNRSDPTKSRNIKNRLREICNEFVNGHQSLLSRRARYSRSLKSLCIRSLGLSTAKMGKSHSFDRLSTVTTTTLEILINLIFDYFLKTLIDWFYLTTLLFALVSTRLLLQYLVLLAAAMFGIAGMKQFFKNFIFISSC